MYRSFWDWLTCVLCIGSMCCCAVGFWSYVIWSRWELWGKWHPMVWWLCAAMTSIVLSWPTFIIAERRRKKGD